MTPETAAIMALAMPLVTQFAAEIAKLPPEQQTLSCYCLRLRLLCPTQRLN
jgi:hypothetical protein